jgi:hypothetical protein
MHDNSLENSDVFIKKYGDILKKLGCENLTNEFLEQFSNFIITIFQNTILSFKDDVINDRTDELIFKNDADFRKYAMKFYNRLYDINDPDKKIFLKFFIYLSLTYNETIKIIFYDLAELKYKEKNEIELVNLIYDFLFRGDFGEHFKNCSREDLLISMFVLFLNAYVM